MHEVMLAKWPASGEMGLAWRQRIGPLLSTVSHTDDLLAEFGQTNEHRLHVSLILSAIDGNPGGLKKSTCLKTQTPKVTARTRTSQSVDVVWPFPEEASRLS